MWKQLICFKYLSNSKCIVIQSLSRKCQMPQARIRDKGSTLNLWDAMRVVQNHETSQYVAEVNNICGLWEPHIKPSLELWNFMLCTRIMIKSWANQCWLNISSFTVNCKEEASLRDCVYARMPVFVLLDIMSWYEQLHEISQKKTVVE